MDFALNEEQKALVVRTLEFARSELNDRVPERELAEEFGAEEWRRCGRFGLLGAAVPRAYGGLGLDRLTTAMMYEAFGKGCRDGGLGLSTGAHAFACAAPIAQHGSEEVRRRWLPALASGDIIGAAAVTERHAGSDALSMAARASRTPDGFRVQAEKLFVTNAPVAGVFVLLASTRPEHGLLGVSAFVVERDREGVVADAPIRKIGLNTSPVGTVHVDCEVPASHCLGGEGRGRDVFETAMAWERTCLFAFWLGTIERQLEEVIAFAKTRQQFGRPIGANQAVSHRIADMKMRVETSRLLLYRACWEADVGGDAGLHTSLAKLAISEAAVQSSIESIQIYGAAGIVRGSGVEAYLRDTIAGTIYSGTSEMHREIVARRLGLPGRVND